MLLENHSLSLGQLSLAVVSILHVAHIFSVLVTDDGQWPLCGLLFVDAGGLLHLSCRLLGETLARCINRRIVVALLAALAISAEEVVGLVVSFILFVALPSDSNPSLQLMILVLRRFLLSA